jgi:hypothetical protein
MPTTSNDYYYDQEAAAVCAKPYIGDVELKAKVSAASLSAALSQAGRRWPRMGDRWVCRLSRCRSGTKGVKFSQLCASGKVGMLVCTPWPWPTRPLMARVPSAVAEHEVVIGLDFAVRTYSLATRHIIGQACCLNVFVWLVPCSLVVTRR